MTRAEAIHNLSVAFGEFRDVIKRQAEAIGQIADDKYKLNESFRRVKAIAKSLPRKDRKSYISPYAKFDRMRRKRK